MVQGIEYQTKWPSAETLDKIGIALEVPPWELFMSPDEESETEYDEPPTLGIEQIKAAMVEAVKETAPSHFQFEAYAIAYEKAKADVESRLAKLEQENLALKSQRPAVSGEKEKLLSRIGSMTDIEVTNLLSIVDANLSTVDKSKNRPGRRSK